jgi:hypothetical protein
MWEILCSTALKVSSVSSIIKKKTEISDFLIFNFEISGERHVLHEKRNPEINGLPASSSELTSRDHVKPSKVQRTAGQKKAIGQRSTSGEYLNLDVFGSFVIFSVFFFSRGNRSYQRSNATGHKKAVNPQARLEETSSCPTATLNSLNLVTEQETDYSAIYSQKTNSSNGAAPRRLRREN